MRRGPKTGDNVEVVVEDGIRFRRYPDSPHPSHRNYYQAHIENKGPIIYLHRYIYERDIGPIPPGFHVHHIDGDFDNNHPSNFEAVSATDHNQRHYEEASARGTSPKQLAHLERIREKTKEWHRSEEGRAWHSEHAHRSIGARPLVAMDCQWCGAEFKTKRPEVAQTCSRSCQGKLKRSKRPEIEWPTLPCETCGVGVTMSPWRKYPLCSISCANKFHAERRKREKAASSMGA